MSTLTAAPVVQFRQIKSERVKLTEAKVRAAPARAKRYWMNDAALPGLSVRIEPSGSRAYYVRGRKGGGRGAPQINHRLDDTARLSLADARKEALAILSQMRQGIDPRAPVPGKTPIAELLDEYEASLTGRRVVKTRDVMASLRRGLERHRRSAIGSLTLKDCVAEIDRLEALGMRGAAANWRVYVTGFLKWSVGIGCVPASPMAAYHRPSATRAERLSRGQRAYTGPDALKGLWDALRSAGDPTFAALLQLGLLTGLRRGELARLRWSHVNLSGNSPRIELPAAMMKTGEAHSVPLGPLSLALLDAQPRMAGTDLVFPGRRNAEISGWSKRLAPLKKTLAEPGFGLHALRKSYRSGLSDLGVPLELAELMIGHKRPGLVGVYDKSGVWPARVEAQARWEGLLSGL